MIRAIFFDFDGVLTTDTSGSLTTNRSLAQSTGIALASVEAALRPFNRDLILGKTTHAAIWPALCGALGRALDIALLQRAFDSTPMNLPMLALARALKRRHAVGVITDNKADRIDHLTRRHHLAPLFDPIVVSAHVGSDKQGTGIFEHALKGVAARPEECVFIDNHRANLLAPAALGFRTLFHDDGANDVEALGRQLTALGADARGG